MLLQEAPFLYGEINQIKQERLFSHVTIQTLHYQVGNSSYQTVTYAGTTPATTVIASHPEFNRSNRFRYHFGIGHPFYYQCFHRLCGDSRELCGCPVCREEITEQAQFITALNQAVDELNKSLPEINFDVGLPTATVGNPHTEVPEVVIPSTTYYLSRPKTFTGVSTLSGYTFREDLKNLRFSRRDLSNAVFQGIMISECDFTDTNLNGARFVNCDIRHGSWGQVDLRNATFDNCTFTGVSFWRVRSVDSTTLFLNKTDVSGLRDAQNINWHSIDLSEVYGLTVCTGCDTANHLNSVLTYVSGEGEMCEDCSSYCEDCNETYANSEGHRCRYAVHLKLRDYNWSPSSFKPKGNFPTEPLMGLELEVEGDITDLIEAGLEVDDEEDHLYFKRDGSVEGIEIVTHPMTLNWAKRYPFQTLLTNLENMGADTHDGTGIHVHVSRNAFDHNKSDELKSKRSQHTMRWLKFMYTNQDSVIKLARRDSERWAPWEILNKGDLKRKADLRPDHKDRYLAINCCNTRTYEVRVFQATVDYTEFMAALELVDASVNYTRTFKSTDVLKNDALNWGKFYEWCKQQGSQYTNLLSEMATQGTI